MYDARIRNLFDLKIFVNLDLDLALSRRILRDIRERGRDLREVLHRFHKFVKKDYNLYVKDQMSYANLIIPGGNNNASKLNSCRAFGRWSSEQSGSALASKGTTAWCSTSRIWVAEELPDSD